MTGDGGQNTGPGVILHYDGHAWAKVASSPAPLGQPVSDGHGGLWATDTTAGASGVVVHYFGGSLTAVAMPTHDGSRAAVDSISPVPGTTEELAGGVFPLPAGKTYSPPVIFQYG